MPFTPELIDDLFTYHPPTADDQIAYQRIRDAAKAFAQVLVDNTPACADQTAAVRLLRQTVQTANASIALKGKS